MVIKLTTGNAMHCKTNFRNGSYSLNFGMAPKDGPGKKKKNEDLFGIVHETSKSEVFLIF